MPKWLAARKSFIKNTAIVLLVAATVAQTCGLWFGGLPGLSWFTGGAAQGGMADSAESLARFVAPYRVVTNIAETADENKLDIRYNDLDALPAKTAGEEAIEQLMRRGEFVGAGAAADLSRAACVAFEYAFAMPADVFAAHFKGRASLLTSRFKQFDAVVLTPDGTGISIAFEDRAGNAAWRYRLTDAAAAAALTAAIEAARQAAGGQFYAYGGAGVYPAEWAGRTYAYDTVAARNPFGELTIANLARVTEPFFDGSRPGAPRVADGVYAISNDRTVLYYYPNGVLECYFNYQHFDSGVVRTPEGSYAVALGVLAKDAALENEYYLSGVQKNANGYTFAFDAALNNYPLVLSKDLRAAAGLNHMIEITVDKESVRYRRYVAAFALGPGVSAAAKSFADVSAAFGLAPEAPVSALQFGYRVDGADTLYLSWFVEIGGTESVFAVE